MADQFTPLYTNDFERQARVPEKQINETSLGLSTGASAYRSFNDGIFGTAAAWLDTNVLSPYITDSSRPKLDQAKVNQLWAQSGIADKAPDAAQYNDVSIYYLLDRAERRKQAERVDEATPYSLLGTPVRATSSILAAAPENLSLSFIPAGRIFQSVGLTPLAAGVRALEATAVSGSSLATRVAARAATGAIEGGLGMGIAEAVTQPLKSDMGHDYNAAETMYNIAFGAALGGGLHTIIGGLAGKIKPKEFDNAPEKPVLQKDADILKPAVDGTVSPEVVKQWTDSLPIAERNNILTKQGTLTKIGEERFNNAIEYNKELQNPETPQVTQLKDIVLNNDKSLSEIDTKLPSLAIKEDFKTAIQAVRDLKDQDLNIDEYIQSQDSIGRILSPETQTIAKFIDQNINNPEKIDQGIKNYNAELNKLEVNNDLPAANKMDLLNKAFDIPDTAFDMTMQVSPQTRETALRTAVGQAIEDQYPTVDSIVKSDPAINKATEADITRDFERADNPENSYLTDQIPPRPEYDSKTIPLENNIDYVNEITTAEKQIEIINKLSEYGLYSLKNENDLAKSKFDTAAKDLGSHKEALKAQLRTDFGRDADKLLKAGKLEIVNTAKDIPGIHPENTKGVAFANGKAYIVADNINLNNIRGVVMHEVGVHTNLRSFVGENGYNNIINDLDKILENNKSLRDLVESNIPENTPEKYRNEEKLAYFMEEFGDTAPFVAKLYSQIKTWLYTKFPSLQNFISLTQTDLYQIGYASVKNAGNRTLKDRSNAPALYSKVSEGIDLSTKEIENVDDALSKIKQYKADLQSKPELFKYFDPDSYLDQKDFVDVVTSNIQYINKEEAKSLYQDLGKSYNRYLELGKSNARELALDYTMDKIQYGLVKHKLALTHDRAIKQKLNSYIENNWADNRKAGLKSLTIGTNLRSGNSREFVTGELIANEHKIHMGNFVKDLEKDKLLQAFNKGIFNDDIMRAMELLEQGGDTNHLPIEAVQIASHIHTAYDNILADMRNNGLLINKVKNYFANQSYLHDETKIHAATFDKWRDIARRTFDYEQMAEAMNIKVSDVEGTLEGIYKGLSTGDHIGSNGSFGASFNGTSPFRTVNTKQRKIFFKDANAAIEYRNEFGSRDFQSSVLGTLQSNSKQLGMLKALGISYERNLNEIAKETAKNAATSKEKLELEHYTNFWMDKQLKSIDGRSDRPGSEIAARACSNLRALKSISSLGMATLRSIPDVVTTAHYLNKNGIGKYGTVIDSIVELFKTFKSMSEEQRKMLSSLGVYNESLLHDTFRQGLYENSTGKILSKMQSWFFRANQLDRWTRARKLDSMDGLANYMGKLSKKDYDSLGGIKKELELYGIDRDAWDVINKTNTRQVDGKDYINPAEIANVKDYIKTKLANTSPELSAELLDKAADRYATKLKDNLHNFLLGGLSQMVLEPGARTKYLVTWAGTNPGTLPGELARFTSMFKSFTVEFTNRILLDHIYDGHNSVAQYLKDWTGEGLQKKWHMAKFVAASSLMWYLGDSIANLAQGKMPRPLFDEDGNLDKKTIGASLLGSGGLGIAGDFLFGNFNRFGGGLSDTLLGPVIGGNFNDIASIISASRENLTNDKSNWQSPTNAGVNLLLHNTPFVNLFYTSMAWNYMFAYSLQEYMNPGYLNRLERRTLEQNDQTFWLPPSQNAVQY